MTSATVPVRSPAAEIPFASVEIVPEAQEAALRVLRSGWVTTGPQTVAFERDLADHLGVPHALAVSSCTAALELALRALRLPAGAPVLTPSLTFCGAVQAIVRAELRPVLTDVDEATLLPSVETVELAVARAGQPAAFVVQHQAGFPAPVAQLAAAAGLPPTRIVEDAAHGLGGRYADGTPVGGRGHAVCLSFYATKNLPIGEGGAVLTDDPDLAAAVGRARLHGMSKDSWSRYLPGGSWRYTVDEYGLKANFTDLQAAIGRAQLAQLPRWQRRRAEIARRYDQQLADVPGLGLPARPAQAEHAWHLYQVRVRPTVGRSRDELIGALSEAGVGTSVHFIPVHHMPYFQRVLGPNQCAAVPVTDSVAGELLSLPMHPWLTDAEVDRVASAVSDLRQFDGGKR